jgi:hypothetical protein
MVIARNARIIMQKRTIRPSAREKRSEPPALARDQIKAHSEFNSIFGLHCGFNFLG